MLRIAVPNKGMLSEPAWNMLAEAGYRLRTNPRQLVVQDPDNGIELFYLRPLDIAVYVGRGAIDVGITGRDSLKNSDTAALEHMPLGFGTSTFRFAAPNESPITTLEDVQGKRVATTFDKLVHDYLVEHGIRAETIHLTVRSNPPCSWAWPTSSPTWSPPVPPCATPACACLPNRSCTPKPA